MLSGVRLTPYFSKCCRKKERNTVSDQIFLSLEKSQGTNNQIMPIGGEGSQMHFQ